LYDPKRHYALTFLYGQDPGVACLSFGSVAQWLLGQPDQAVQTSGKAVRLSREQSQPSSLALALHFAAMLRQCRREAMATQECAETALAISTEHGFSFWQAGGTILRGWALAEQGDVTEGVEQMRQGLASWQATGSETYRTYYLALLAEALGRAGRAGEGLDVVAEALALVRRTGEGLYEAELHRLRGVLLLQEPSGEGDAPAAEAETCFRQALASARRQGAKSLELRAVMSLARLQRDQGRPAEGRELLAAAYGGFIEGWVTPDLRDAKALLEQLA
jgi:predicted ATPase